MSAVSPKFEIGLLYSAPLQNQLFLAVSHSLLISIKKGILIKKRPRKVRFNIKHGLGVEDLCNSWNISLEHLDEITLQFLPPITSATTQKRKGPKLTGPEQTALAKKRLTVKIVA